VLRLCAPLHPASSLQSSDSPATGAPSQQTDDEAPSLSPSPSPESYRRQQLAMTETIMTRQKVCTGDTTLLMTSSTTTVRPTAVHCNDNNYIYISISLARICRDTDNWWQSWCCLLLYLLQRDNRFLLRYISHCIRTQKTINILQLVMEVTSGELRTDCVSETQLKTQTMKQSTFKPLRQLWQVKYDKSHLWYMINAWLCVRYKFSFS